MQKKLHLALVFAVKPKVIFLDEPSAAVDPVMRNELWEMIEKYQVKEQASLVICTHTYKEADALGKYFMVMDDGRIIRQGFRSSLIKNLNLKPTLDIFLKTSIT